jgi:hypothetical protein
MKVYSEIRASKLYAVASQSINLQSFPWSSHYILTPSLNALPNALSNHCHSFCVEQKHIE